MTVTDYNELVSALNTKYDNLNATVHTSKWGGGLYIEVSNVDKSKALAEMFTRYTFTSNHR